jgi:hypothetical protein
MARLLVIDENLDKRISAELTRRGIRQLEPATGIEPVTCCLQNSCSAN